ncbi:MAG: Trehalase [Beijerinckiaceae bacterium]|nr:MAG: Trehalase [Beijerinckiaceae bacterium]
MALIRPHPLRPTADSTDIAIRDLAVIGDRRTAAVLTRDGTILWYCPGRFDRPSLLAGLLDPNGGAWRIDLPGATPAGRGYLEESGVLETWLRVGVSEWAVTDWMPAGADAPSGLICRLFSAAPCEARVSLKPCPDYARAAPGLVRLDDSVRIGGGGHHLYASHQMVVEGEAVVFTLPEGETGWAVLSDAALEVPPARLDLDRWLEVTLAHWSELAALFDYEGPYKREVAASLRAIRLLSHEASGGIVAAATTSLPEVPGGSRNWDYRYAWLRDAGMIVSALTRLGGDLAEAGRYLDFICSSRGSSSKYPMAILTTLDGEAAPTEEILDLAGFDHSRPVRIGNNAGDQLQLDGFANVLLAAKLLYQRTDHRPHWDAVEEVAEFLVRHWREPDHGIWEEEGTCHYTANKVIVACALASVAEFSDDASQARRWRAIVGEIRDFVSGNCLTKEGAYAAVAGREAVDVSAALFPAWGYTEAGAPEMRATIAALERDHSWNGLLYWRHLECADARFEGTFLAGVFWVAQYWVLQGDLERARRILDAGLGYANDLGLFAEEADPREEGGGRMLGNIPQSFVHAAFIGAVIDLKHALARLQASVTAKQKE